MEKETQKSTGNNFDFKTGQVPKEEEQPGQRSLTEQEQAQSPERFVPVVPISRQSLHQIVGKLLLDPGFRELFVRDARMAVENAGISLTPYEFSVVEQVMQKLADYAELPDVRHLAEQMTMYTDRIYISSW